MRGKKGNSHREGLKGWPKNLSDIVRELLDINGIQYFWRKNKPKVSAEHNVKQNKRLIKLSKKALKSLNIRYIKKDRKSPPSALIFIN